MKERIMGKASMNSAKCIYLWEASGAQLAEDATLVGPLFTRSLRGAKAIREFYRTSGEVAGPLKVRWHMNEHVETSFIGGQVVGEHNVHSALWLERDAAGGVTNVLEPSSIEPAIRRRRPTYSDRSMKRMCSPIWLILALLPTMRARKRGRIVKIGTV
jgi:hypothetical protein